MTINQATAEALQENRSLCWIGEPEDYYQSHDTIVSVQHWTQRAPHLEFAPASLAH